MQSLDHSLISSIAKRLVHSNEQFFVWDNFLRDLGQTSLRNALLDQVKSLEANNELKFVLNQVTFRTDKVKWITSSVNNSLNNENCFDRYMRIMSQLQSELFSQMNRELYDKFGKDYIIHWKTEDFKRPLEIMLSCYPSNSTHYDRHLDDATGKFDRIVTLVYYLSDYSSELDFQEKSLGGHLRLFYSTGTNACNTGNTYEREETFVDIAPIKDRLVLFSSRNIAHEVRPVFFKRFAISMWFHGRTPLTQAQLERIREIKIGNQEK
jgi:Rps23 Pro-64 3,4-dihydroxylase Tpa1-like proline 4-hydroxylase